MTRSVPRLGLPGVVHRQADERRTAAEKGIVVAAPSGRGAGTVPAVTRGATLPEFTGLMSEPNLISIALVSEDGREFYAELTDTWGMEECDPFVQEQVLPLLDGGDVQMTWDELTERLPEWIAAFGRPVRIATDAVAADWEWIQKICYAANSWPTNLSHQPLALPSGIEAFEEARELCYASGMRRHHALDDAKVSRECWSECRYRW